ncbi:MAG: anaerobic glycerol-3-phosphate dehydrogenase subunit C [Planctomycetota bacterium]
MDVEQQRIEEDLRGQIAGEVRCDDLFVQLYSTDASIYEIAPLGVVRPRTVEDVVAVVRYAGANQIPLHARGSGSGLAGESLGRGLIVDFSRYLRRVLEINEDTVRVQAGVVIDDLNRQLAPLGRKFGPDPATSHVSTIGGVISLDSSGSRWRVYGSARHHVQSLEVVLASGELVTIATHDISTAQINRHARPLPDLLAGLQAILNRYDEFIPTCQPRSLVNRCGYRLDDIRRDEQLCLSRLFTGSEGTLGMITSATLTTSPIPSHAGSVLLFFDSLEKAARGSLDLARLRPSACDMMDRRHLSLARESDPRYELLIPQAAEAVLLVEFHGESTSELQAKLRQAVEVLHEQSRLSSGSYVADDQYDHQMLWQLARRYVPTLYRLKGNSRPVPVIEDIAVAPEELPDFLHRVQQTLKKEQVTASFFGHAGHGQLHIRPFLDLADPGDVTKMSALADQVYQQVWDAGGTISGEHGDGLSRTPYVAEQYGPLADAFHEVKELFDPQEMLNPGKIVALENSSLTDDLRRLTARQFRQQAAVNGASQTRKSAPQTVDLQLDWQPTEIMHAARTCNGCAACRTQSEESRMCPIYRYAPREEASPRAKANLARGILTGSLPPDISLTDASKTIADLCVNCHMCRLECPANVDIPKLMLEAKAAYVATNGERLYSWLLTRVDLLCATASKFHRLSNWAVGNRVARWIIEKLLGIAKGRKLPRFTQRPYLQQAAQQRLNRPQRSASEKVLYFVDTYANYCDTQLAEAFVAVLGHNGIATYVPESQRHAAMPQITNGVLDPARQTAEHNVALLAEAVRQGYKVVATEPSAVLALTHEYPTLLPGDHDAKLVSENTYEACHYLWKCHQRGKLQLDFSPLQARLGYHTPCHVKALQAGSPTESLLDLIPGLQIEPLEKGCSGIAGTYGLGRENYRNSLRAGLPLLTAVRTGDFKAATTNCSACKIQMEQGTSKPTIHPIKLVALAYGLMPELRQLLDSNSGDLVVT